MFRTTRFVAVASLVLLAALPCAAQTSAAVPKDIILTAFEAQKGIDFPPDFQEAFVTKLVEEFTKLKKFNRVIKPGDPVPENATGAIRLTGLVTEVDEGSRAARALVGWGAGKAYIKAHVKFVDEASGAVKFEKDVQASMSGSWSVGGGDASKVGGNLAKEVAKVAKSQKF
jgi:Domain of unknown function (DUF4410)